MRELKSKSNKEKYKHITQEQIEKQIEEIFTNSAPSSQRKIRIITWEGGYKLFCEVFKKEVLKLAKNDGKK